MALLDFFSKQPEPPKSVAQDILDTVNLRNIDLPMPKEQRGFEWVLFGPNNSFPLDLLEYRNSSSIHDSILSLIHI